MLSQLGYSYETNSSVKVKCSTFSSVKIRGDAPWRAVVRAVATARLHGTVVVRVIYTKNGEYLWKFSVFRTFFEILSTLVSDMRSLPVFSVAAAVFFLLLCVHRIAALQCFRTYGFVQKNPSKGASKPEPCCYECSVIRCLEDDLYERSNCTKAQTACYVMRDASGVRRRYVLMP